MEVLRLLKLANAWTSGIKNLREESMRQTWDDSGVARTIGGVEIRR
jgi:hypothetical protein